MPWRAPISRFCGAWVGVAIILCSAPACRAFGTAAATSDAGAGTADGGTSSCTTCDGGADGAALPPSCNALHAERPDFPDGVYLIDADGAGPLPSTQVYCDMSTDGGGWTLVARSVPGTKNPPPFGWEVTHGSLGDEQEPFSLGVSRVGLTFTEILFGARGEKKQWGTPVYKHVVPPDFLSAYKNKAVIPTSEPSPSTVLGTCRPATGTGPTMLGLVGHTSIDDHYAFHDDPDNPSFGLFAEDWATNAEYDTEPSKCTYSGALTGKPGMIFVR